MKAAIYEVTYFYLATGMEGRADERCLGQYIAVGAEDARTQAIELHYSDLPKADQEWVRSCLSVRRIN